MNARPLGSDARAYDALIELIGSVPGATHLLEEPGALDQVALLAREWFERYLVSVRVGPR